MTRAAQVPVESHLPAMTDSRDYPTLADTVGKTPLVRLQRMPGTTSNVILGKLEGNNPAGSVKDRPALSMIVEAERRGDIRPGDTLIEATSGNTGIALAMVAAIKGYKLILVMPDNQSLERVQTMRAYGAELVQVTKAAGMEGARDLADRMQAEGKGHILNQFANPDNPLAHYRTTGPEIWRDTGGRITHFVSAMGTTGTIMGVSKYLKEQNPDDHDRRRAACGGRVHPRYPQVAGRIPAEDLRRDARRPHGVRHAARCRGYGAPPRAGGRNLRRNLGGRRVRGGAAHFARGPRRDHRLCRLRPRRPIPVDRCVSRVTPILVFDIETVPDVAGIRRINDLPEVLPDAAVMDWFNQKRRAATGNDFAPHYLQQVVAIACALRSKDDLKVWSVGDLADPEPELIRRFFGGIEQLTPQLVSWNGGGFDLPVLNHRALIHGINAEKYWDWGDQDREFKFNSYLGRYHTRHLDLMDVLAMYQPRANAGLDAMARLCGFPGKLGMDGSQVAAAVTEGKLADVRNYCECDVMNTYLVYQRFRLMRGELSAGEYAKEIALARERIAASGAQHWREFMTAWNAGA